MELKLDRVTKQYKNIIAVDRVSARLKPGVYGLLGANGAGKTTLMRMICGVLQPTSGEISLDGIDVSKEEYRDMLGYLPQDFGYYPEFSAMDFLLYIASLKGITKRIARERAEILLEEVNLSMYARKKIKTYSGGMKQRLGIAQALMNNPKVVILDEPTAGLDPKERVKFRNLISRMGSNKIVLLSTHIVSDIEYIADQIFLMKDGKLIHSGSLNEILQTINGKVWEGRVANDVAQSIGMKYPIINIREEEKSVFLRVVSEKEPFPGASCVEAVLEDLYLYYFSDLIKEGTL